MSTNKIISISCGVAVFLFFPFIAMQMTSQVNWDLIDFGVAGLLLISVGLTCNYALQKFQNKQSKRIAVCLILFLALLLYVELAVGVFGSPFGGS